MVDVVDQSGGFDPVQQGLQILQQGPTKPAQVDTTGTVPTVNVTAPAQPPATPAPTPQVNFDPADQLQKALSGVRIGPEQTVPDAAHTPWTWPNFVRNQGLGTRAVLGGVGLGGIANAVGLPQPESPAEKILSGINTGITGAGATFIPALAALKFAGPAAATTAPVTSAVADTLAAQPVRQAIAGGLGGGAGATAGAMGAPPWLQSGIGMATALGAGTLPGAGRFLGATSDDALIDAARTKYDIPIYPGQTGSAFFRNLFSEAGKYPGSGGPAALRSQQDAFNQAVGNTFGATTVGGKLTPEAMTAARNNASAGIEQLINNTKSIRFTNDLGSDLSDAENGLLGLGQQGEPALNFIRDIRQTANSNGGFLPADWVVRNLSAKSTLSQSAANGLLPTQWSDIKGALFRAVEDSATPADLQTYQEARQAWKNMSTVEKLVARGGGDVSPGSLSAAVAGNKFQRAAYTGGGDLGELGEIGARLLKPPPDSGTAIRTAVHGGAGGAAATLALERAMHGQFGDAAKMALVAAVPFIGFPVASRLMQMGARGSPAPYYALRTIANPAYQPFGLAPPPQQQQQQVPNPILGGGL